MRVVQSDSNGLPQVFSFGAVSIIRGGADNLTATFTSSVPHRLQTGMYVRIVGADLSPYNSASLGSDHASFMVTVTGAATFTYTMPQDPGGNADVTNVQAQRSLESKYYDPFSMIRNGRLQVEERVPDGSLFVNDAAAHAGNWTEIVALENVVVAALASSTLSGFVAGMKIPAGLKLKGVFTSITLTSGSIVLNQ